MAQSLPGLAVHIYRTVIAATASIAAAVFPLAVLTALGIVSMGCPICFVIFGCFVGFRLAIHVWPKVYHTRQRAFAHLVASLGFLGTTTAIAYAAAQWLHVGTFFSIAVAAAGLFPLYLCEMAFDRSLKVTTTST